MFSPRRRNHIFNPASEIRTQDSRGVTSGAFASWLRLENLLPVGDLDIAATHDILDRALRGMRKIDITGTHH